MIAGRALLRLLEDGRGLVALEADSSYELPDFKARNPRDVCVSAFHAAAIE